MVYVQDNTMLLRLITIDELDIVSVVNRFTKVEYILDITEVQEFKNYIIVSFSNELKSGTYNLMINSTTVDTCIV